MGDSRDLTPQPPSLRGKGEPIPEGRSPSPQGERLGRGFDLIAFGEVMVRLAPPHFQRLEQARSLDVEIGGAELNTAVGVTRLGRTAAWVSVLPDNPLGRLVANRVREAGV